MTTKSFAKLRHPITSADAMNGREPLEGAVKPAIMGSMKYGPNLGNTSQSNLSQGRE